MLQPKSRMTLAQFLLWDEDQPEGERYEFLDGEIVAFGQGATQEHNRLVSRLAAVVLANEGACRTFVGMQRLAAAESGTYPDIVLTCDQRDFDAADRTAISYPKLIIEVLSPRTAGSDLTTKRHAYAAIPTLEEYLVVDSRRRYAQLFGRAADFELVELWAGAAGSTHLRTLGVTLDVGRLYADIIP